MISIILAAALAGAVPDYGPSISLTDAKRVLAAAQADAARRQVSATVVIVDRFGELVLAQAAADADGAAFDNALAKARQAVNDRRGTPMSDRLAASGGAMLVSNGKVVGAIGDAGASVFNVVHAGAGVLT
jgi:glc operon protein GlcG